MKLVDKIQVVPEPLSDERLTNIERRIVAGAVIPPPRRGRTGFVAAAGIALAAAAFVVGWKLASRDEATGPVVAATATPVVRIDRAAVDIGDARITADARAEYIVTREGTGVLVELARGKVELEVGKRGDRAPLVVRAGDTEVEVIGTRFSVDYGDGSGPVDVRVFEGVVRVRDRGRAEDVRVTAGAAWSSRRGLVASAPAVPAPVPAPVAVAVPVPASPPASPRPRPAPPAALDLRTEIRRVPVLPALPLATTDPAAAIRDYGSRLAATGHEASLALYSIAVVQHLRLGRDEDALATLETYMRRFVGGNEYRAALWLRVRIACLARVDARCRRAAYTYAHDAAGTPAGELAERITITE